MAHIVRTWLVTPHVGCAHPKTEVLRMASRRGTIALRARKIDASGTMRVVARGISEHLAAFNADLHHKVHDDGWARNELVATPEDEDSVTGGELRIIRTDDMVSSGIGSSGHAPPPSAGAFSPVDSGSTASSRLLLTEVKLERERGEALVAAALEAAAAHEAAALEAAAAREAVALEAAAVAEAREAAALEAAAAAAAREDAAAAREAAAVETAAAAAAAAREVSISTLMRLAQLSRADAEKALGTAQ